VGERNSDEGGWGRDEHTCECKRVSLVSSRAAMTAVSFSVEDGERGGGSAVRSATALESSRRAMRDSIDCRAASSSEGESGVGEEERDEEVENEELNPSSQSLPPRPA